MSQRYKSIIEYNGTGFSGWQRQKEDLSIQQVLEDAIFAFTGCEVPVFAAGRTDAGVHAMGQVVHFDLPKFYEPFTVTNAINFHLRPHLVSILDTKAVDDSFHARFSAIKRYYRYQICNRHSPLALDADRYWHVNRALDVELMQEAAQYLVGTHDFTSFRAMQCQAQSPVKTMDSITVSRHNDVIPSPELISTSSSSAISGAHVHRSTLTPLDACSPSGQSNSGNGIIYFDLVAQSFLHHMVRNIVGTLKMVGDNKIDGADLPSIIAARDRSAAGITAPACGLYFVKVDY